MSKRKEKPKPGMVAVVNDAPIDAGPRRCISCGCTDDDCRKCIRKTGAPCWWVRRDLCSACVDAA